MKKKALLIKIIRKIGKFLPEFLWFVDLIENNSLDDEFIDIIISHLEVAINHTKITLDKDKLDRTKNILRSIKNSEIKDKAEIMNELNDLEHLISNL